jgi:hypothetical protein
MYNFHVHYLVKSYSSFWRFLRLNSGTVTFCRAGDAAPRRACLDVRAHPAASRGPHLPEVPRPEVGSTPRRLEVSRATRRTPVRAQGACPCGPPGMPLPAIRHAAACDQAAAPARASRLSLCAWHAGARLFKALSRFTHASAPTTSTSPPSRHARRLNELRFHSTRRPLGLPGASLKPHRSSQSCALPRAPLFLAGRPAAAGTAAARRRGPSLAQLPPIPSHQIGRRRAGSCSPSFPRPRAAADSPESGHPRRRPTPGTQLRIPETFQGLPCKARTCL